GRSPCSGPIGPRQMRQGRSLPWQSSLMGEGRDCGTGTVCCLLGGFDCAETPIVRIPRRAPPAKINRKKATRIAKRTAYLSLTRKVYRQRSDAARNRRSLGKGGPLTGPTEFKLGAAPAIDPDFALVIAPGAAFDALGAASLAD